MNNIYLLIPHITAGSSPLALATVIETQGSTPQKHGSSALFDSGGLISGTIGGGILEGKVQQIAKDVIKSNRSGIYHFNLDNDISFKQDAICGGKATILIDASPSDHNQVFDEVRESLSIRVSGILITAVSGKDESDVRISRHWVTEGKQSVIQGQLSEKIYAETEKLFSELNHDGFKRIEFSGKKEEKMLVLFEPLFPAPQLIIAGAGHIGRALSHLGKLLGFEITVIDSRAEYANNINIPEADHLIVEDIGKAMAGITKNSDTYIVIVTRGHDDDAKALRPCINSGAAYVGMIGSKKKIAKMHLSFVQNGWATQQEWSAIHAPIGLDILSQTVEEIAVSIAAQLIMVRNSKK
jgi:xanthine dehydrogenase accessory factor